MDFRSVLMNTLQGAYNDIANINFSGTQHSHSTDARKGEKKGGNQNNLPNPFGRSVESLLALSSPYANHTPNAYIGSAGHVKLVADKEPRNYIPAAPKVAPNKKKKATETLPVNSTKPAIKNCANKKRGKILTLVTSNTKDTTSSKFLSVTLPVLPQERAGVSMEMDALLDTSPA